MLRIITDNKVNEILNKKNFKKKFGSIKKSIIFVKQIRNKKSLS
jgi:hypothetical protein